MGSETVTIGGREFRVGAWYSGKLGRAERRLTSFDPNGRQPGGTVRSHTRRDVESRDSGAWWQAHRWVCWAGDEVKP